MLGMTGRSLFFFVMGCARGLTFPPGDGTVICRRGLPVRRSRKEGQKRLKRIADRKGISVSGLVRMIVLDKLNKTEMEKEN